MNVTNRNLRAGILEELRILVLLGKTRPRWIQSHLKAYLGRLGVAAVVTVISENEKAEVRVHTGGGDLKFRLS